MVERQVIKNCSHVYYLARPYGLTGRHSKRDFLDFFMIFSASDNIFLMAMDLLGKIIIYDLRTAEKQDEICPDSLGENDVWLNQLNQLPFENCFGSAKKAKK